MHELEQDLGDSATVLRLDLFSPDGRAFMQRYGLQTVPAFVVLDPAGTARYQTTGGLPDPLRIQQAVRAISP